MSKVPWLCCSDALEKLCLQFVEMLGNLHRCWDSMSGLRYGLAFGPQQWPALQQYVGGGNMIWATDKSTNFRIHFLSHWVLASAVVLIGAGGPNICCFLLLQNTPFVLTTEDMLQCGTLKTGSIAERVTLPAQIGCAFFTSSLVYPVAVHWIWDSKGWLSAFG